MSVDMALETYMSHACQILSDLQFRKNRDSWNPELLPNMQSGLYDGENPQHLYPRTDDDWRKIPMTTILEWLRSFVLRSSPQGSASRSSAETMISKIRMGPDFIANPKTVELFFKDVFDVESEFPETNQAALSKLLINDFNSKTDRGESETKQFKALHDEIVKGEFMRTADLTLMMLDGGLLHVEKILQHKGNINKKKDFFALVRWEGLTKENDTQRRTHEEK